MLVKGGLLVGRNCLQVILWRFTEHNIQIAQTSDSLQIACEQRGWQTASIFRGCDLSLECLGHAPFPLAQNQANILSLLFSDQKSIFAPKASCASEYHNGFYTSQQTNSHQIQVLEIFTAEIKKEKYANRLRNVTPKEKAPRRWDKKLSVKGNLGEKG